MSDAHEYPPCTGQCCQGLALATERLTAAQAMIYDLRDEVQRLNAEIGARATAAESMASRYRELLADKAVGERCVNWRPGNDATVGYCNAGPCWFCRYRALATSTPPLDVCDRCGADFNGTRVRGKPLFCAACTGTTSTPPATPAVTVDVPLFECACCKLKRTRAEGGAIFTVCDTCWDAGCAKEDKRCPWPAAVTGGAAPPVPREEP